MKVHLARGLGRQALIGSKVAVAVAGRPRRRSELERQVLKQATALLECERAACLAAGEGQAGFARSRAILCLAREISIPAEAAGQCEWSRLLVRLGRPLSEISVNKFAEKNGCCHFLSNFQSKTRSSYLHGSGQQIVSSTSRDPAPNEFTDGGRFGQDNARIDIRGVAFAPGDMRLIDQ
jgi:hypothetical protein